MKSKLNEKIADGQSLANEVMKHLHEKLAMCNDHITRRAFLEELGAQLNEFADKYENFETDN